MSDYDTDFPYQVNEMKHWLKILQDLSQKTCECEHLYEILDSIVSQAINLASSKTGIIYLLDKEGKNIIDRFTPDKEVHPEPRIDRENGLTRSVFVQKETIYIKNCDEDSRINPELKNKYKSMIAIPLKLQNNVIGVLYLNSDKFNGFSELMIELLHTLASQSAVLIYEKRFESMVNNLTQSIFQKDRESKFTFANKAFIETIKHKLDKIGKDGETYLERLIGCSDFDIYEKNLAQKYVDDDKKIINREKPIIEEFEQHQNKDKKFWVKVVKTPLFNRDREIIGTEAIFWDVDDEKIAHDRYEDLFHQSPDGIVIHKEGKITQANEACLELFGVNSTEELIGQYIIDLIFERDKEIARNRLNSMLHDKNTPITPEIIRLKKQNKDRGYSTVKVYAKPSFTQDKEIQVVYHKLNQDQDTVFISYDHRDVDIVDEMLKTLAPLKNLNINIWAAHKKLKAGDNWHNGIQKALSQTKIAILMESFHFANSHYINDTELPEIVKEYNNKELIIFRISISNDLTKDFLRAYPPYLDGGLNSIHMLNNGNSIRKMTDQEKRTFWEDLSDNIIRSYNSVPE